jgi:multiple sugar transport system substrate-binding protein
MTPQRRPGHQTFTRRRLLAGGGALAAGTLVGGRLVGAGRRPASADLPTLSQWYHGYGEEGVQEAVERFAAAYPNANIEVEWFAADYDSALASALLTDEGPDVFEAGNGPNIDMIQGGQVVPLDGILGDAEGDFNERMISRLTFDGHLWAVPQIVDMQFVVYRKSLLEEAGLEPPQTLDDLIAAAAALTTGDTKGLFVGNDGGAGLLGGPILWSAGADYLTPEGEFGFDTEPVYAAMTKLQELYDSDSLLLGAPADWFDPSAFINELTAIQFTGLWTIPQITDSAVGDDFDVIAWPQLDESTGSPSVPIGAFSSTVSARSVDVEASKAFVQWLWVDQTEYQLEFATAYGFHIPARNSLAAEADVLKEGPAANAVRLSQENGFTQTPILWTPASGTAYSDALNRIIAQGADPASEIAEVRAVVEAELERIGAAGGTSAGSAPTGSAPAATEPASSEPPATTPSSAPATTG